MEKSIIAEGKTSNEAINNGLKKLGCKLDDVEVKVLENEDKKVFFSILDPRVVKVQLTVKETGNKKSENYSAKASNQDIENCMNSIKTFLDEFSKQFGDIKYDIKEENKTIYIDVSGEDSSKLIGYRGETINALQILLSSIGNKETENRVKIIVDICDYKNKREETLNQLASKLERTVTRTGRKIVLEPMNAYERKILHLALQDSKTVTTYSIGEEPRRKLVVEKK